MAVYDVQYMKRTRDFYRAQGYNSDYKWAQYDEVPFAELEKPLSESRVAVITTSMPNTEIGRTQRQVYSSASEPVPQSMFTAELSWHKTMTHTNDVASFIPLAQLQTLKGEGIIRDIAPRFHSVPTEYSQRNTIENDAPEILAQCLIDKVDVAILVPL